jgi:hypothetical protein
MTSKPEILLWLDGNRGRYLPRDFACSFANRRDVSGISSRDWRTLQAGPDHDWYWEAWDNVCDHAKVSLNDVTYTVYMDGDCWLIPEGMQWDDGQKCFTWPDNEMEDI